MIRVLRKLDADEVATALLRARPIDTTRNSPAFRTWLDAIENVSRLVAGQYARLDFTCKALGVRDIGHDDAGEEVVVSMAVVVPVVRISSPLRVEERELPRPGLLGRLQFITSKEIAVTEQKQERDIKVGDRAKVESGRFAGYLIEVVELSSDGDSVRGKFDLANLTGPQIEMLRHETEQWLPINVLQPVHVGEATS